MVLALPAGKSGHLELGWALGQGKRGYILLEESDPERFDIMYLFATKVVASVDELIEELSRESMPDMLYRYFTESSPGSLL